MLSICEFNGAIIFSKATAWLSLCGNSTCGSVVSLPLKVFSPVLSFSYIFFYMNPGKRKCFSFVFKSTCIPPKNNVDNFYLYQVNFIIHVAWRNIVLMFLLVTFLVYFYGENVHTSSFVCVGNTWWTDFCRNISVYWIRSPQKIVIVIKIKHSWDIKML